MIVCAGWAPWWRLWFAVALRDVVLLGLGWLRSGDLYSRSDNDRGPSSPTDDQKLIFEGGPFHVGFCESQPCILLGELANGFGFCPLQGGSGGKTREVRVRRIRVSFGVQGVLSWLEWASAEQISPVLLALLAPQGCFLINSLLEFGEVQSGNVLDSCLDSGEFLPNGVETCLNSIVDRRSFLILPVGSEF